MIYKMEYLGSFDIVKHTTNYEDFKNIGKEKALVESYAKALRLGWLYDEEKEELLNRIKTENNHMILRGGNVAVRIVSEKEIG